MDGAIFNMLLSGRASATSCWEFDIKPRPVTGNVTGCEKNIWNGLAKCALLERQGLKRTEVEGRETTSYTDMTTGA